MISIENLSKFYGHHAALNGVHLQIPSAQTIGLLGPNGAGKTTLIKILTGMLKNYQGQVRIGNHPIGIESKKITAYLPDQDCYPQSYKALQMLQLYKDFFSDFDPQKALELLDRFQIPLRQPFKNLSKGTKEKLQLILTLSRKAKLFIFDEPLGGVDPIARQEILDLIIAECQDNATILLSTHLVLDVQDHLDWAIFIKQGKIIAFDRVATIKGEHASLEGAYKEYLKWSKFLNMTFWRVISPLWVWISF